jgi:hypothetical protein
VRSILGCCGELSSSASEGSSVRIQWSEETTEWTVTATGNHRNRFWFWAVKGFATEGTDTARNGTECFDALS